MKTTLYVFAIIILSFNTMSCTAEAIEENPNIPASTGDEADDPVEPEDEQSLVINDISSRTGDEADDPVEPDDED